MCWWNRKTIVPSNFYLFRWLSWEVRPLTHSTCILTLHRHFLQSSDRECSQPWIMPLSKMHHSEGLHTSFWDGERSSTTSTPGTYRHLQETEQDCRCTPPYLWTKLCGWYATSWIVTQGGIFGSNQGTLYLSFVNHGSHVLLECLFRKALSFRL